MMPLPPHPQSAFPSGLESGAGAGPSLDAQWAALAHAATATAALAGPAVQAEAAQLTAMPRGLALVQGRRAGLIAQSLTDLVAVMQPGIVALLETRARGGNAAAPATALWREFVAAREGVLALVPADLQDSQQH
jgi:hypothetical protein